MQGRLIYGWAYTWTIFCVSNKQVRHKQVSHKQGNKRVLNSDYWVYIKDAVQSVCKQRLCLHFGIQNIEFYSTAIYIFMILEYNKLSRDNNQALPEHKMK